MATITTPTPGFTAIQLRVLDLLATGRTIAAAARECEIDRTTIYHWRRTNPDFAMAGDDATLDARAAHRTAAQAHAEAAFNTLRQILDDEDAPASVRCKAALYILNAAKLDPAQPAAPAAKPSAAPDSTQFNTFRQVSSAAPAVAEPQVGRNSPCPCHSGRKYKQCCLLKKNTVPAARTHAATGL